MAEPDELIAGLFDRRFLFGLIRRRRTARAIAGWGDAEAVEPLCRALVEVTDPAVHRIALERLGALTEQVAIDVVCEYWAATRNPRLAALITEKGWQAEYAPLPRLLGKLFRGELTDLVQLEPDEIPVLLDATGDTDARVAEAARQVATHLQRADSVQRLVDLALLADDVRALKVLRDAGYQGGDPATRVQLLLLSEQVAVYLSFDPSGTHLGEVLKTAPLPRRQRLAEVARNHHLLPWTYAVRTLGLAEILPSEWDSLLLVLAEHGAYEDIWKWSVRAPVPVSMRYVRHLAELDWAPPPASPQGALFGKLASLAPRCEGDLQDLEERISERTIFEGAPGQATVLATSSDWHYMAVGGDHHDVRIFSLPDGEPVGTVEGMPGWTRALAFAGMGRLLAVATMTNRTQVLRLPDALPVASLETVDVTAIAFRGDGRLLAASCGARIDLWDVEKSRIVHALGNQGRPVKRLELSPRGSLLAAWGGDGVARVWSLPEGALLSAFDGAEGGLAVLSFSPDERFLAISDRGGIVRVYELPSCELVTEIAAETKVVRAIAFRPDGLAIAVGGHDHCVRLFSLPDGDLLGQMHAYAGASTLSWNSLGQLMTAATEGNRSARLWFPALPPMTVQALQTARADEIAWAQRRHSDPDLPRDERAWLTAWGTLAMAARGALPRRDATGARG
ncbi:MAG: HEAT repeat domain-containing protein [Candidatus Sericytochromatia bacterium]|nr:HEAT repeat domain-containing protein [Candidatus Sericytochromatia bacterium]